MTRGTELLLLLAIGVAALTGFVTYPFPMLAVAAGLGRWAWVRAAREELLARFG